MKTQLIANEQGHDSLMSIRQAAKVLGVNRVWLSAYLEGRKVRLVQIGPSLCIQRSEVEKIRLELESEE